MPTLSTPYWIIPLSLIPFRWNISLVVNDHWLWICGCSFCVNVMTTCGRMWPWSGKLRPTCCRTKSMRRLPYHSRGFACPYKCGLFCKTPGGVTRHKSSCAKNPANIYIPSSSLSPPNSPSLPEEDFRVFIPPPYTPAPANLEEDFQAFIPPPYTPANIGNVPIYKSPRCIWWITKGGERMRIHPHLDGSSIHVNVQLQY